MDNAKQCIITVISHIKDDTYAYGSGFFVSKNGHIITSAHNCNDAKKIMVLHENNILKSKLIGIDNRTDIAVLKINPVFEPECLKFSTEEVKSGDECYILGNHADSAKCICHVGHVKFDKYISGHVFESIVVDVNVNKGTSGSPILDNEYNIIGMVNWFMDRDCSGGTKSNYIKEIYKEILEKNIIEKSYIGFKTRKLKLQDIVHYNINMAKKQVLGELITEETTDSFLKKNDIITKINDEKIGILHKSIESVVYLMKPGEYVSVEYYKFCPENGMAWMTQIKTNTIKLKSFPSENDKPILGKSKIRLN
jgi:S1-C subfamily serine protease